MDRQRKRKQKKRSDKRVAIQSLGCWRDAGGARDGVEGVTQEERSPSSTKKKSLD